MSCIGPIRPSPSRSSGKEPCYERLPHVRGVSLRRDLPRTGGLALEVFLPAARIHQPFLRIPGEQETVLGLGALALRHPCGPDRTFDRIAVPARGPALEHGARAPAD